MSLSGTTTAAASAIPVTPAISKTRIATIDVLRGLVMVIMLMDHVRERFYYFKQVTDPMDVNTTEPDLFFTRLAAHLCAPVFVFLTGMSAWLYSHPASGNYRSPTGFLFKRGLFLVFIEVTVINFSWAGTYETLWLQVIWAIGLSMIALSLMVKLQYWVVGLIGFAIVFGHNLLTPISFAPGEFGYTLWAILHDRGVLLEEPLRIKASYPILPWIGVIALGYFAGPLYARTTEALTRRKLLVALGVACWALLLVLRGFNIYGETLPWTSGATAVQTLMSFLNYTKYPPSLDFLLMTLGTAFFLMAWFETLRNKFMDALEVFGSAPMFFYIVHLYVLLIGYRILLAVFGTNQGEMFGVDHVWGIWLITIGLAIALYLPTRAFARYKHQSKKWWLRYL
ncbi:MAG: DUF1624 domain-containing protein [Gammaproteobacteria bacterium]|uniref:DUF1624 domain-containing protein n=1 Tax=Pseudomaricurvus alcaniphilus TaxID=1166482 RepID=UPI00140A9FD3|nr:heparan-alpha-glucosaminide N-acetyltransferase domain-containing protein [Pseudomaricurvus alcaniphilus]MBR9908743.1 DUF1624 domain-containing protein [Gammaproteobacteria bacterium]NHN37839.1 DUF1624 domain-containing protein [Pseudomaricurvus alcaniphilus]